LFPPNGTERSCKEVCPSAKEYPAQCARIGRHICERNLDTFKPIKEKNVREKCCKLPLTNMTARDANDCPYAYHQIELPDGSLDETNACKSELLPECIVENKPEVIVTPGCESLGTSGSAYRDVYNTNMKKYCEAEPANFNNQYCSKWCDNNASICTRPSNPGSGNPGSGNPGSGNPGSGNPGSGNPGSGDPGYGEPCKPCKPCRPERPGRPRGGYNNGEFDEEAIKKMIVAVAAMVFLYYLLRK
jgi:hypothetical protein